MAIPNDDLRTDISRLLTAAAQSEIDHAEGTRLAAEAHQAEVDDLVETARRLVAVHAQQVTEQDVLHSEAVNNLRRALESRDLIGQAKGVLIVSMRCTDEHAFEVLVKQSQHENRKVSEVARDVVDRALARAVPHLDS